MASSFPRSISGGDGRATQRIASVPLAGGATYHFSTIPLFTDRAGERFQYWPDGPGHYIVTFEYTGDDELEAPIVANDLEFDLE